MLCIYISKVRYMISYRKTGQPLTVHHRAKWSTVLNSDGILMAKRKVVWPKPSHNNMEAQSGANLTSTSPWAQNQWHHKSQCHKKPTMGGGLDAGEQESPSTSNVEREYDVVLPDKGKGKAVPDNTTQGGSGHDPSRDQERMSHLLRWNESDDHSQSHSMRCCLTTRSDDKEILDELLSRMDEIVKDLNEAMAEVKRRVEEIHINMQDSVVDLRQSMKVWKERWSKWDAETSRLWDGWLQTHHTRDDEPGLSHPKDLCSAREGHEQDGQVHRPSNEPNDRSQLTETSAVTAWKGR